jgi:hypothetical protein
MPIYIKAKKIKIFFLNLIFIYTSKTNKTMKPTTFTKSSWHKFQRNSTQTKYEEPNTIIKPRTQRQSLTSRIIKQQFKIRKTLRNKMIKVAVPDICPITPLLDPIQEIKRIFDTDYIYHRIGCPRDATEEQIKTQFRKIALKIHPTILL